MEDRIEYLHDAFSNLLDKFAKCTKEGQYKKVDYQLWRDLKYFADERVQALIYRANSFEIVLRLEKAGNIRNIRIRTDDGSLGTFLHYELVCSNLQKTLESDTVSHSCEKESEANWVSTGLASTGLASADLSSVQANRATISNSSWNNKATLILNENDITFNTPTISCSINEMGSSVASAIRSIDELREALKEMKDKDKIFEERKENEKMFGLNFDFGSCEHDNVKMSMYGLAVKNASGEWVSYDKASKSIINVDILNFDGGKFLYKMPVALKDVKAGDIILHARKPMFVSEVVDGKIIAADPFAGEEKIVLLTRSPFGFDFATKIVNFFDGMTGGANAAAPFGNMLPLLMMGDGKDIDPMVMMMAMGGQMDMSNPMMMYALMSKDGKANDILPFLMMGMNGGYGCHCDCDREG